MKRSALILLLAICTLASQNAMAATSKSASRTHSKSTKSRHASHSGSDFGFKRAGIAVGLVSPEDMDATFGFGAFADLGTIAPRLGLEGRLDYWGKSDSQFGFDTKIRDITLGARTKYYIEVQHPTLRPFVGAGLGVHFLHAEVEVPAFPGPGTMTADDSETRLGIDLGGGVVSSINPVVDFHAEAWYGIVSDVNQFSLRVGLSRRFGS